MDEKNLTFMDPEVALANKSNRQRESSIDDPTELHRFLVAYRPQAVGESVWQQVATEAVDLVERAGELTRLRVEKDIQTIGAVVAHVRERGRPVTLHEVLLDSTLLSYDTSLKASEKTRENKRGILRRLQAVHRGLPWRAERRADGERINDLPGREHLQSMVSTLRAAEAMPPDAAATAFIAAVAAARAARIPDNTVATIDEHTWGRARQLAAEHNWPMTRRLLHAATTHELLDLDAPVAVLLRTYVVARRDLDLALTRVGDRSVVPDAVEHALLRGPA